MRIEQKLQVGSIALLLSLAAIAGPANAQPNPGDCLDGDPFPVDADCIDPESLPCDPTDPPTCLPEDPTAGIPCIDPTAECPVDPESFPCTPPAAPADFATFVGCAAEFVTSQVDADAAVCGALEAEGETAQECIDAVLAEIVPTECPEQAPGAPFPQCTDLLTDAIAQVIATLSPAVTVDSPAAALQGQDLDVDITVVSGLDPVPTTLVAEIVVTPPGGPASAPQALTLTDGAATFTVNDAATGTYLFEVTATYEEDAIGLFSGSGSDTSIVGADPLPVVDAGDDFFVNELGTANLEGQVTDNGAFTTEWSCVPVQTLGSAISLATSFMAPAVEADEDLVITCTLTATDDFGSASDSVDITVLDVPTPLILSFAIDSLANQDIDNAVLVTGTVSSNLDVADAEIAIALSEANTATGNGAQNIVWSDGDVDTLDLAAESPEAFEAIVSWDSYETVTWTITVAGGSIDFSVTFDEEATYIDFGAGNAAAVLVLADLSASTYQPDNIATPDLTTVLTVTDPNGAGDGTQGDVGRIVDDNIVVGLASDSSATNAIIGEGVTEDADPALSRDFAITVPLPARLKDDTYTLTASYTNPLGNDEVPDETPSVTRQLAVENVAPVIDVLATETFTGTERIASFGVVAFTVDDYNGGTLDNSAVTELSSLALAVREANAGACDGDLVTQGLTLSFPLDGGGVATGATLDLSAVAFSAAIPVSASLAWATTALAGDYELCATLSDGSLEDANVLLATFVLEALNQGFHLTIDDGGNGLAAPGANPGQSTTTEALSILLSGTAGAEELVLTVGNFQRSSGVLSFTASNLNGLLCATADCEDPLLEVPAVAGVVTFPALGAIALPGAELFVVFEFTVPLGTASGNYAAPVTVAGLPAV